MLERFFLLAMLLTSCVNNPANKVNRYTNENMMPPHGKIADSNFVSFIERFSNDSVFQLNRIKFPLKIKWYDILNDKDSSFYIEKNSIEFIDLRDKNNEQWERRIIIDESHSSAIVEMRGVENGLVVDYIFVWNGIGWMLVEINDSST